MKLTKPALCDDHKDEILAALAGVAKKCGHESFAGVPYCAECFVSKRRCMVCGSKVKREGAK